MRIGGTGGEGRKTGNGTPRSSCPTESSCDHPGQPARSEALAAAGAREGWKSVKRPSTKGMVATSAPVALSEAGTFASAASGGRSEQKGVAAVKIL